MNIHNSQNVWHGTVQNSHHSSIMLKYYETCNIVIFLRFENSFQSRKALYQITSLENHVTIVTERYLERLGREVLNINCWEDQVWKNA